MKTADWIVFAASLLMILTISVVMSMRMRAPDEYFTAGRRVRRWLLILFAFGSGTSSDTQSSVMASTWRSGLAGLWWQFLWLPIAPFYWIVAPLLRRLRAITTADFFAMRFGPSTAALYSVYGMIISVVLMAGVLFGGARLLVTLTHPFFSEVSQAVHLQLPVFDIAAAIEPPSADRPPVVVWRQVGSEDIAACCLGIVLIISGVIGGLGSAIVIDAFQGILRIGLTCLMLPILFRKIGGFGVMHTMESLKPGMLDFVASSNARVEVGDEPFTPFYLCMLSIAALAGIIVQPHIITMCGAGRTEMDSRIGFTFGSLLKRCLSVAWAFMGLACILWYLGPDSPLRQQNATHEQSQALSQMSVIASGDLATQSAEEVTEAKFTDASFGDRVLGYAARDILPDIMPGLVGAMAAMVLASVVSHCGTQMIVGSGLFSEHLYRHHIAPGYEPAHYLTVGRLCGPVLVAVALMLQTTFTDITDVLKLVIKTPAVIGISMWMGLVWVRWNTISVWTTTLTSAFLGILCGYYPEEIQKTLPGFSELMFLQEPTGLVMIDAWKIACILSGGLACGVIASILTDPQQDDQLEHFYRVIRTRVSPDESEYADQYTPPEDAELVPAVSFFGFQFPGPTAGGTVGFLIAWVIVIVMIIGTKWLSLQI